MNFKSLLIGMALFVGFSVQAEEVSCRSVLTSSSAVKVVHSEAKTWLEQQQSLAISHIIRNISPTGLRNLDGKEVSAEPGTVLAARTHYYFYHWVRDAGLVMTTAVGQYRSTKNTEVKKTLNQKLHEYLSFSKRLQNVEAKTDLEKEKYTGLGEPKYNLDGSIYTGPWGRPQNDGPALRAISLMEWANTLIDEGKIDFVRQHLYSNKLPADSPIKKDLEYVSHRWKDPSFDLWEEIKGDHFYTRMVHRKAMIEGAKLARLMGDVHAATWYSKQAVEIEKTLQNFWDHKKGYFVATLNQVEGFTYKTSNLDTAVILGLLHGETEDNFLKFSDARVLMTLEKLIQAFKNEYPINSHESMPGVAIGRYPEDEYAGSYAKYKHGNPWVLTTLAVAEIYYKAAIELKQQNRWSEAEALIIRGDQFVERVKLHAHINGSLSEQIHRHSGHMTSVEDLTWNYAAVLTANLARKEAVK